MTKQTVRNWKAPKGQLYFTNIGHRYLVHQARNVEIFIPVDWDQRAQATLPGGIQIEGRLDAVITYINNFMEIEGVKNE